MQLQLNDAISAKKSLATHKCVQEKQTCACCSAIMLFSHTHARAGVTAAEGRGQCTGNPSCTTACSGKAHVCACSNVNKFCSAHTHVQVQLQLDDVTNAQESLAAQLRAQEQHTCVPAVMLICFVPHKHTHTLAGAAAAG